MLFRFSLLLPPSFSVSVRKVTSPSLVSSQLATAGCQSLMAQKPPTSCQISGGRPGGSVLFLTVIAYAAPLPTTPARPVTRTSFIIRMRFLSIVTLAFPDAPARILVERQGWARRRGLEWVSSEAVFGLDST